MKILVTGGTGLVGGGIKQVNTKYEITYMSSKTCNLLDYNACLNYFTSEKPDYVIHLAAEVGGLYKNMNKKVNMFENNLIMNYNVIKSCYVAGVKNLIACLSTCVFPDNIAYPLTVDKLHNGEPHSSNYGYAYSKRMLEVQVRLYRETYKLNYMCIIPTNIYGRFDNFNLENGHVLPALIHKCYIAKKFNVPFIINGSGEPLRQFVHNTDVAKVILNIIDRTLSNQDNKDLILIADKREISIKDLAELIAKEFDYNNIMFDKHKSDGQYKKTSESNITFEYLPLEDGIKDTIKWFIDNYLEARK